MTIRQTDKLNRYSQLRSSSTKCRIVSISRPFVRRVSRGKENAIQEAAMARRNTLFQNPKSIAGATFIGLGVFILFGNLTVAASQLSRLLGITADEADTLGVLTAGSLAATRSLQAYLFDHTEFLRGLYLILLSFWPLVLVIVGTIVLRAAFRGEAKELPRKMIIGRVDFTAPRSTLK
jgi:hypothetical protein